MRPSVPSEPQASFGHRFNRVVQRQAVVKFNLEPRPAFFGLLANAIVGPIPSCDVLRVWLGTTPEAGFPIVLPRQWLDDAPQDLRLDAEFGSRNLQFGPGEAETLLAEAAPIINRGVMHADAKFMCTLEGSLLICMSQWLPTCITAKIRPTERAAFE